MESSDLQREEKETAKIEFIEQHQPTLKSGNYAVTVRQHVQTAGDGKNPPKIPPTGFETRKTFSIAGERFSLNPPEIHSVFPAAGSLGEHSHTFPHIVFNRSTLPWERAARATRAEAPWLALLLFDAGEKIDIKTIDIAELHSPPANVKWKHLEPEAGHEISPAESKDSPENPRVTVIEVSKSLLERILPEEDELIWLSHVRQGKNTAAAKTGDELAVIIGNRLPQRGAISVVHLVSVENRFGDGGFDYQNAAATDLIRLVSLKSWSFACVDKKQSFKGLLENLNPIENGAVDPAKSVLRIPAPENVLPEAEKYLAEGAVPLPHFLRQGGKTVSWYHGPLVSGENVNKSSSSPAKTADELLRYNSTDGMFDVSYAAAWELGRLLAVQNKKISGEIYRWKRQQAQKQKSATQISLRAHLPGFETAINDTGDETPADLRSWAGELRYLKGIPFNYLVPDERMLPNESIRFFQLDNLWMDCLLDGIISVGKTSAADYRLREILRADFPSKISGVLLRSNVVAGWTGLIVDAFGSIERRTPLKNLRRERISPGLLLCLFEGELKRAEFHLSPEAINFGFDVQPGAPFGFYKNLKDHQGKLQQAAIQMDGEPAENLWRSRTNRIVNIKNLAASISAFSESFLKAETFTSAHFALQMVDGTERVVFQT